MRRGAAAKSRSRNIPAARLPEKLTRIFNQWRHPVENRIGKLKEFKRIAMRSCKTDARFAAMIYAASAVPNPR